MNREAGEKPEHQRRIIAGMIILGLVIILGAAILSLSVTPDEPGIAGTVYPYTTTFHLSFPEARPVRIGTMEILALQAGDRMALRIGDRREEMDRGELREITDRTATVRILGQPVFQTGYRLDATWTGMSGNRIQFRVTLHTQRQVPDWLISRILPADIEASPA